MIDVSKKQQKHHKKKKSVVKYKKVVDKKNETWYLKSVLKDTTKEVIR